MDEHDRARRVAEIEAALRLALPEAARRQLEITLSDLRAQGSNITVGNTVGRDLSQAAINLSDDARVDGLLVGVNLGTVVYGRAPEEDERRRTVWYLARLANRLRRLPLRGLDPRLDESDAGLTLARVYIELATTSYAPVAAEARYFESDAPGAPLRAEHRADQALPSAALLPRRALQHTPADQADLLRPLLAAEAVARQQHLVLLGDPGSGKSTFLRYLAWTLARRGLDQAGASAPAGWHDDRLQVPVIVPLRRLAGRLGGANGHAPVFNGGRISKAARRHADEGSSDAIVLAVLREAIEAFGVPQADDLLAEALHRGAALLLFDGLDEVPLDAAPDITASREAVLRAVHDFAQLYDRSHVVVTCRTRAFDRRLEGYLRWHSQELAPFTLGQVRHFVPAWYGELAANGHLEAEHAARLQRELVDAIAASPKLRAMAETPLLLTMMALVLYHDGTLPRDRPLVYERILELLLGQWDKLRDGQSLAEAIGHPDWTSERILPVLDQLSYAAHESAASPDGRGRIDRRDVYDTLISFFETARLPQPWESARRCLEYFEQRSGLLVPDDNRAYVFAHLTLQEHCAGRHMLLGPDAVRQVLARRTDDRWREPIMLGLGVVQRANPTLIDRILSDLIDDELDGAAKPAGLRQRDLVLAAEIGEDRDWDYLRTQRVNADRLQRGLRRAMAQALADTRQPLPVAERARMAQLLGRLGDPRIPVTLQDWRREVAWAQASEARSYFCLVEPGSYPIGSLDDDLDADDSERPRHVVRFDAPFWIARFPITIAQWLEWGRHGGDPAYFNQETPELSPTTPVVGVFWRSCNQFCAWLSRALGVTVRLPAEYEWEAAARGPYGLRYPWGDEWLDDRAALADGLNGVELPLPVGCFPAGAAPCGAQDMAGNVGEWVADLWHSYPGAHAPTVDRSSGVLRGGGIMHDQISVRGAARTQAFFATTETAGFRVVLELE